MSNNDIYFNIRYVFKLGNEIYINILGIEGVENGWVEAEFKKGAQVIGRDLGLKYLDKNNIELFVNDIIKEFDGFKDRYYKIIYNKGGFFLHEITGFNFDETFNFGSLWDISKLVEKDNIFINVIKIGDLYNNKEILLIND